MADEAPIHFRFEGNAEQLLGEVKKIASALKGVQAEAKETSSATGAASVAMGSLMAQAGTKILAWGKDAFGAFNDVAGGTRKLQRILGGTAEDMSRLRFAGQELGVSTEAISKSMAIAATHLQKNDDIAKKFGVSLKDATGHTKSSVQVLGELADRLKKIPDPLQKTAAAKELFGRGFAEMLPLLNQGSAGIKKFAEESDKLGLTMSQKDLDASKKFGLQMKELKASVEGVFVAVGRALMPVLGGLVKVVANAVEWVRHLWERSEAFRAVMKTIGIVLGVVVAGILTYMAVTKVSAVVTTAWTTAQTALNAALEANPIGIVIMAIIGLIAVIIALVKNFEPVGNAIIIVGKILGTILGDAIGAAITMFRLLADVALEVVDKILMGLGWLASGLSFFTFGLVDATGTIDKWRGAIQDAKSVVDKTMGGWADAAFSQGGAIGEQLASGLVNAIKNLKMPSLGGGGAAAPTDTTVDPNAGIDLTNPDAGGAGGGGKAAVDKRKQAILDFFKQLVESSYNALEALKQAAKDIRQKMLDLGKSVSDALNSAFSITDVSQATFAQYLGPDALVAGFRKRLADMKEFTGNLRQLIKMGLPKEMLIQIATAGVSGGAATARMLVQHPEVMAELQSIQKEITSQTAAAGEMVGAGVYGADLAGAEAAATGFQKVYARRLGAAQSMGYQATQEQINAATNNIHNEINMINNVTNTSPADIERAVAWALKTGTALGMGPGGGGGGGGLRPPAPGAAAAPGVAPTGLPWVNNPAYFTGGRVRGNTNSTGEGARTGRHTQWGNMTGEGARGGHGHTVHQMPGDSGAGNIHYAPGGTPIRQL